MLVGIVVLDHVVSVHCRSGVTFQSSMSIKIAKISKCGQWATLIIHIMFQTFSNPHIISFSRLKRWTNKKKESVAFLIYQILCFKLKIKLWYLSWALKALKLRMVSPSLNQNREVQIYFNLNIENKAKWFHCGATPIFKSPIYAFNNYCIKVELILGRFKCLKLCEFDVCLF